MLYGYVNVILKCSWFKRVATGKNEKEYSWHVPAIKFIGMKQLV